MENMKDKCVVNFLKKGLYLAPEVQDDSFLNMFASNHFSIDGEFSGIPFEVEHQEFIMNASETVVPSETGQLMIKMVESSGGTRHEHYLKEAKFKIYITYFLLLINTQKDN